MANHNQNKTKVGCNRHFCCNTVMCSYPVQKYFLSQSIESTSVQGLSCSFKDIKLLWLAFNFLLQFYLYIFEHADSFKKKTILSQIFASLANGERKKLSLCFNVVFIWKVSFEKKHSTVSYATQKSDYITTPYYPVCTLLHVSVWKKQKKIADC